MINYNSYICQLDSIELQELPSDISVTSQTESTLEGSHLISTNIFEHLAAKQMLSLVIVDF